MTARAAATAEVLRLGMTRLEELMTSDPSAAEEIARALVEHLRQLRPEQVVPMDAGWEPTERERDPRSAA